MAKPPRPNPAKIEPVITYRTEEEAFERVEMLKSSRGIWPGVVRHHNGLFSLTHEPPTERIGNARTQL